METRVMIQSTPNPNALKFVLNAVIKTSGNATFKNPAEAQNVPLAQKLFAVGHVKEIYLFDNYITVTQDGDGDWDELEGKVKEIILASSAQHNPDFIIEESKPQLVKAKSDNPEIAKVEAILDETIRPALQMDGGGIQVTGLNGNTLTVFYQGACGSCPSSAMGTLKAIENLLRDQYNPEIVVELA